MLYCLNHVPEVLSTVPLIRYATVFAKLTQMIADSATRLCQGPRDPRILFLGALGFFFTAVAAVMIVVLERSPEAHNCNLERRSEALRTLRDYNNHKADAMKQPILCTRM